MLSWTDLTCLQVIHVPSFPANTCTYLKASASTTTTIGNAFQAPTILWGKKSCSIIKISPWTSPLHKSTILCQGWTWDSKWKTKALWQISQYPSQKTQTFSNVFMKTMVQFTQIPWKYRNISCFYIYIPAMEGFLPTLSKMRPEQIGKPRKALLYNTSGIIFSRNISAPFMQLNICD